MRISTSMRWLVVAVSVAMLLAVAAACSSETVEVPGETVVIEKEVVKTVEVPGETVTVEVVKEVQVPGETVVVKEEVVKTVEVPGETVVVKEEVIKTVEVPGETVTVEVVKTVEVPGETVVVEKEVVKTVEVPGQTVVVEKEVVKEVRAGYVTDPTTGEVVEAPQYGGTFTYHTTQLPQAMADPYLAPFETAHPTAGVAELLLVGNWGISRDEFDFKGAHRPMTALKGSLAESWETSTDGRTITFHIRQGVNWQDKAPMNGRELTAYDIEYNYQRYLGLGSGFTEAAEHLRIANVGIVSVEATDDWTVEFKLKEPVIGAVTDIGLGTSAWILAPEVIKEYGDHSDWRNMVGTGPFTLTELVEGVSATWEKNPDYWGYDEKYPENRLPYFDRVRTLKMVDPATKMTALRTGKFDFVGFLWANRLLLEEADSIRRTNPEIVLWPFALYSGQVLSTNPKKPPFDDIRVRHALEMALDHETVNDTYFKGLGVWKPEGRLGATLKGYATPFDEWPEEVKQYYTYDPAGAEELLEAAGYPRGADGVRLRFPILFEAGSGKDMGYVEIAIEYWKRIGVEVTDIQQGEEAFVDSSVDAGDWHLATTFGGLEVALIAVLQGITGGDRWGVNDPDYDALVEAAAAAETVDEQMRLINEANNYLIEHHFMIWGPKVPTFAAFQPWVKGHNGETSLGMTHGNMEMLARLWIDQALKEAMGY